MVPGAPVPTRTRIEESSKDPGSGREPAERRLRPGSASDRRRVRAQDLCLVAEQFVALAPEKASRDGDPVISHLQNEPAGDETGSPFEFVRATSPAVSGDVFLGNSVDDGADSRPDAGPSAHGAGLVGGVENEVGQVAAVTARHVLERLEFDMLDART